MADFPGDNAALPVAVVGGVEMSKAGGDASLFAQASGPPVITPPTLYMISPVAGTVLQPDQTVSFNVNDATTRILIAVSYPGLDLVELAYDGDGFTSRYSALSVTSIAGDTRTFALRRAPLWPSPPQIMAYAFAGGVEL